MPALNFKSQFAHLVASGKKNHTIRALRKRPFKFGDRLAFYKGSRFKPKVVRCDATCIGVADIEIDSIARKVTLGEGSSYYNAGVLTDYEILALAMADGFACTFDFFEFFYETHGAQFKGQLIEWRP